VEALLRDLGPRLRRGGATEAARSQEGGRLATGLPLVDDLIGGGFPRGRLSEIAGWSSSGRTSLALALLAGATRAGETCAWVDAADGLDPASARAAGVVLEQILWVRAPGWSEALESASHLIGARGFGLVLLDLTLDPRRAREPRRQTPPATWTRLARAAAGTDSALVVLSLARITGTAAEIALEMTTTRAGFRGSPPLLEELETEARLVRCRTAPAERRVRVRLAASHGTAA
jgi:RecA/RadA recombinase